MTPPTDSYEARVSAPSRLHFGLLSFGAGEGRRYGGLGAMIDQPGLRLSAQTAEQFAVEGPLADRAKDFARRLASHYGLRDDPQCRIRVETAPPEHVGLGTGTQLGLAVAAAIHPLFGQMPSRIEDLAAAIGRGARSAIGTHGFAAGGLLFEEGKLEGEAISPLVSRVELPESWRFVLFWPDARCGLSGDAERDAFCRLHSVSPETTRQLTAIARNEVLPAAAAGDLDDVADALHRYGHLAGLCFAGCQAGAFATDRVAALVEAIGKLGVVGTGQSSWGPTVYALVEDEEHGKWLVDRLVPDTAFVRQPPIIATPNYRGATIQVS